MICDMNILELDHQQALSKLPDRDPWGHKGSFGRVLLICGSRGFTGAAWFAAMGALRCGAGLVYLAVPESIYPIMACKLNEPVMIPLPDRDGKLSEDAVADILGRLPGMDAVLIGCGMGYTEDTLAVTKAVMQHAKCPVVVDADGINVLSGHKDILRGRTFPTVLTPHDGEFARLDGALTGERMQSAGTLAKNLGCVVLLKGHRTCITDGHTGYINTTGNPGMAAGGSGDILAGMLTALLGQGLEPLTAAAVAAWFHGAAGDLAAERLGQYGMLPSDLLEELPRLLK